MARQRICGGYAGPGITAVIPSPGLCRVFSSVAFKALLFWEMLLTTT